MGPSEDEPSGGECGGCEYEGKMYTEGAVVCMGGTNHECTKHVWGEFFWNDQRTPCRESAVDSIPGSDIPDFEVPDSESTADPNSQESYGELESESSGYGAKENEYGTR